MEFGKIQTLDKFSAYSTFFHEFYIQTVISCIQPKCIEDKRSLSINSYSFSNKTKIAYFIYIEMRCTVYIFQIHNP